VSPYSSAFSAQRGALRKRIREWLGGKEGRREGGKEGRTEGGKKKVPKSLNKGGEEKRVSCEEKRTKGKVRGGHLKKSCFSCQKKSFERSSFMDIDSKP
jgi:hypothetical protein